LPSDPSPADYHTQLSSMTDEEIFETMLSLEKDSEKSAGADALETDVALRLELTEEEIRRRYPGQLLAPYLDWKKRRLLT
jgi:hypothetical protein